MSILPQGVTQSLGFSEVASIKNGGISLIFRNAKHQGYPLKNKENTMTTEPVEAFDQADIDKNKTMAGLAYIIFFLPLVACPDSRFGRYHGNQALVLFLAAIIGSFVLGLIPIIGWILLPFYSILIIVLVIMGLLNGLNGKAKELPIIGKFKLLK
jgi:uncharacterized membrane protein